MKYYEVGKIINTHGIKGEVKILATTDFVSQRFVPGKNLYIERQCDLLKVKIKTVRRFKQFYLLSFFEYSDLTAVEKFKNARLLIAETQQAPLEAGNFYYHQIVGLKVVDQKQGVIGQIKEIMSLGANDVWVVHRTAKSDLLLPAIKNVIRKIDLENQRIEVELPDGLDEDED